KFWGRGAWTRRRAAAVFNQSISSISHTTQERNTRYMVSRGELNPIARRAHSRRRESLPSTVQRGPKPAGSLVTDAKTRPPSVAFSLRPGKEKRPTVRPSARRKEARFLHLVETREEGVVLRILLADDHSLFREMLTEVLRRKTEAYAVIGEAGNGAEALTLVTSHRPDLLLLDYKMPHVGRLSLFCQDVRRRSPATRILIVSGYVGEKIALEAAVGGARGYILKGASLTDLLSAITTIQAGGVWVHPQLPRHVFHTFLNLGGKATENLGQ